MLFFLSVYVYKAEVLSASKELSTGVESPFIMFNARCNMDSPLALQFYVEAYFEKTEAFQAEPL